LWGTLRQCGQVIRSGDNRRKNCVWQFRVARGRRDLACTIDLVWREDECLHESLFSCAAFQEGTTQYFFRLCMLCIFSRKQYTFSRLKEYRYFQIEQSILNVCLLLSQSKLAPWRGNINIYSISKKQRKSFETWCVQAGTEFFKTMSFQSFKLHRSSHDNDIDRVPLVSLEWKRSQKSSEIGKDQEALP
jgi:hypothetical protein